MLTFRDDICLWVKNEMEGGTFLQKASGWVSEAQGAVLM